MHFFTLLAVCGYIGLPIAIVLFWQGTSEYGQRYLFGLFPIAFVGYVNWKNEVEKKYKVFFSYPLRLKVLQTTVLSACIFGLVGTVFYFAADDLKNRSSPVNGFWANAHLESLPCPPL